MCTIQSLSKIKERENKMKKHILKLVLICGLIVTSTIIPVFAQDNVVHENELIELDRNLILNSSFDNGTNWSKTGNGSFTNYPGCAADTNGWCGLLPSYSGNACVYQIVNLKPNTDYVAKAKIQLSREGQTVYFNVKNDQVSVGLPNAEKTVTCTKDQEWVYQDITLNFNTGNYSRVSLCVMKWTESTSDVTYLGQAYVDDVTLVEGNSQDENYDIMWADDFNGTLLNDQNWDYELGHIRGVEQQHYVRDDKNIYVKDGLLTIKATNRALESQYTVGGKKVIYNSGSIRTHDKQEFLYGRIEMRAKLPKGKGVFPAFWTLGSDFLLDGLIGSKQGYGWARCGEIDIMELTGTESGSGNKTVWQTVHTANDDNDHKLGGTGYTIANDFNDDYHIFGINWSKNKMEWYVDNKIVSSVTYNNDIIAQRCLNKPQYIQLNLAMGGAWPGEVGTNLDGTKYDIDYVYYAQNSQQKADAQEYYSSSPKVIGAKDIVIQQGNIPDLLKDITTTEGYHIDYSIDDDGLFNNDASNSKVNLVVNGETEKTKIAALTPGKYTIYYTAIPDNATADANHPNNLDAKADYRFNRKTVTLIIE